MPALRLCASAPRNVSSLRLRCHREAGRGALQLRAIVKRLCSISTRCCDAGKRCARAPVALRTRSNGAIMVSWTTFAATACASVSAHAPNESSSRRASQNIADKTSVMATTALRSACVIHAVHPHGLTLRDLVPLLLQVELRRRQHRVLRRALQAKVRAEAVEENALEHGRVPKRRSTRAAVDSNGARVSEDHSRQVRPSQPRDPSLRTNRPKRDDRAGIPQKDGLAVPSLPTTHRQIQSSTGEHDRPVHRRRQSRPILHEVRQSWSKSSTLR